jgi:cob(I)alamin adenosyltransferase
MTSISTKKGDSGQTTLARGVPVSKGSLRVDSYGTVDELNSAMGFARAICNDEDIRHRTKAIQQQLFQIGSSLATAPESRRGESPVSAEMIDALTAQVHELEALDGILSDWSVSGESASGAAYDLARTICRRAERCAVRLVDSGEAVESNVLIYLNRLSDLLFLFSRKLELNEGADASLRHANRKGGPRWSKAW